MSIAVPQGWEVRIVLGAEGRPVLHAASFDLPTSDDDSGEVARETFGGAALAYLNVRDLGPGAADDSLPVHFDRASFDRPPDGPGNACCRIVQAARDVSVSGHAYRVTLSVGGDDAPPPATLEQANEILETLALEPHEPAAPAPPPAARELSRYGIAIALPDGWDGEITRGELVARGDGLSLRLLEHGGSDARFVTTQTPVQLTPAEFLPREQTMVTGHSFVASGREFVLWVEGEPTARAVERANQALATLRIERGDFYPGLVDPATFAPAGSWTTGTSGSTEVRPDGQQTFTWASTAPYRDEPEQFPPYRTKLEPDDVLIHVQLYGPTDRANGRVAPPFRVAQAERNDAWEGQIDGLPLYRIAGRAPGQAYDVGITILFGRAHPTDEQLAAADAELDRLNLPDWETISPAER
jgi:hypothetical protein